MVAIEIPSHIDSLKAISTPAILCSPAAAWFPKSNCELRKIFLNLDSTQKLIYSKVVALVKLISRQKRQRKLFFGANNVSVKNFFRALLIRPRNSVELKTQRELWADAAMFLLSHSLKAEMFDKFSYLSCQ